MALLETSGKYLNISFKYRYSIYPVEVWNVSLLYPAVIFSTTFSKAYFSEQGYMYSIYMNKNK
jgi:hypothetical protein